MGRHPLLTYADQSGRSISEIAKAAGVSRMTLYRLIKGEQNATISLLESVSRATGNEVPIDAFLPGLTPSNRSYERAP